MFSLTSLQKPMMAPTRTKLKVLNEKEIADIAELEITSLKRRSRLRMLQYQKECESEKLNDDIISDCNSPVSQKCEACSHPQLSSDISSSELDSIVLPSHGILPKDIKVSINGINDSLLKITSEAELKCYIYETIQDKELAILKARSYRDQVESLQEENRNVVSTMNKRIQAVTTFWRNKIAEGSRRAGRCVLNAVQ